MLKVDATATEFVNLYDQYSDLSDAARVWDGVRATLTSLKLNINAETSTVRNIHSNMHITAVDNCAGTYFWSGTWSFEDCTEELYGSRISRGTLENRDSSK